MDNYNFEKVYIEEYCNLEIYPQIGIFERIAGFLNDFIDAYLQNGQTVSIKLYGNDLDFLKDSLNKFDEKSITKISYVDESIKKFELIKVTDVILSTGNEYFDKIFDKKIEFHGKSIYLNREAFKIFKDYFKFYRNTEGKFVYDNLICLAMIVKNAGPLFEKVLTDNLHVIDRWCILDTGSTDGTQEVIKRVLKDKKGELYEEPFVDFKVSRNRCLDLAGKTCKFILMLDDTYSIRGDLRSFLSEVRGDIFSDSFSLLIQSDDTEYYSNRIIKSDTNLRYIHTIHEVINNVGNNNVTIPANRALIFDNRSDYMEKRTMDRKQFDLQLLFKEFEECPDDPRALYYIAQTYGCIGDEVNKAKYFELRIDHPVQGYVQEKIDALFELARCYNFKIDCLTKLPLNGPLTPQQWEICEKLYLQAFELDSKRPDSLYFIGVHYYLEQDYPRSYEYMKKAFEIGYPLGSQYSLKPTLSFHFLPKFLAELTYYFSDFTTGLACSQLFLTSTKFNNPGGYSWNLMMNWYKIHENMCKVPQLNPEPVIMDRPIFCIVTDGGWEPWTGSDIETKGLGGSETWIVETARYISKSYHVVVFCKTDQPRFYENVGYNPIEMFHEFIANYQVEHVIVSRYTEYVPVALHGHSKNVSIIFHDNLLPETIIPVTPKIKKIFGLTQWHCDTIKNIFPQFYEKINFINYGIDHEKFDGKIKTANSFIYSSFPNRGLVVLLKMWPKIVKRFPDATLNIYCDLEQEWVNNVAPEMMESIKKLLKVNRKGIKVHGWVSKNVLAEAWNTSEYFLYPCIFEETFCLTALEAAISRTCVISNGLAALSETVGHRGITVLGNPLDEDWQMRCLEKLFHIMRSNNYRNTLLEKNYNWAITKSWETQTNEFLEYLN